MRINKFIASYSEYSRRKAEELIQEGKVKINGKISDKMGIQVDPEKDTVEINNKKITPDNSKIYIALHKPEGYVSTRSDENNNQTIMELCPQIPNLKPVGRLDKDTEGLILLSNDGEFINFLTHPRYECLKSYFVKISGILSPENKQKLEEGVTVDNKKTASSKIKILKTSTSQTVLIITIHEGRNRQIRKMFSYLNHHVKYLKRISIGPLKLGDLKKGQYRSLTNQEINALKSA